MPDSLPFSAGATQPALLDAAGAAALVASYAPVSVTAAVKDIGRIDAHMGRFIALSPICLISTADASGKQDVTPRGDPPGSFKVLDEKTIALADRPGNNRLDTLRNLLENPEVALIFLLPGVNETVRVAGTARLSVDPKLATGDGALGFWKALPKVFPTTRTQRCCSLISWIRDPSARPPQTTPSIVSSQLPDPTPANHAGSQTSFWPGGTARIAGTFLSPICSASTRRSRPTSRRSSVSSVNMKARSIRMPSAARPR